MSPAVTASPGGQLGIGTPVVRGESLDLERLRLESSRQPDGGRLTLEQLLDRVWEGLHAAGVADCPVCGSERLRTAGCEDCGSRLR